MQSVWFISVLSGLASKIRGIKMLGRVVYSYLYNEDWSCTVCPKSIVQFTFSLYKNYKTPFLVYMYSGSLYIYEQDYLDNMYK